MPITEDISSDLQLPPPGSSSSGFEIAGINWPTTLFLAGTLLVALVATPLYVWRFGVGVFELSLFFALFVLCGMSITVGYHRLFSHCTFRATWPVRLATNLFGAGAFESSVITWAAEHRYHHRFTDQDGHPHDPHSIERGFLWAHVGWLLVRTRPALEYDNVADLRRDPIVAWQDRYYLPIAIAMGFLLPTAVGLTWALLTPVSLMQGLLAGFLFGGCTRIVLLQHATFLINSAAHTIGTRPYDHSSSARDSTFLAFFTFGEGYHNFHHAFQADFRNGVRAWHWDPGKWIIWTLSRLGLASDLRRVPAETVHLARLRAKRERLQRHIQESRLASRVRALLAESHKIHEAVEQMHIRLRQLRVEERRVRKSRRARRAAAAASAQHSVRDWKSIRRELRGARRQFKSLTGSWRRTHRALRAAVSARPSRAVA